MSDLTPAEAKFFETGELSPELAADVTPPVETPPVETPPVVTPPVVAAPPVAAPGTDPYSTLQRQLIEAESRRAATEQQLTDLVTQLQALQQQGADVAPDPNTDPFGALQHQVATINASIQNLQAGLTAQNDQTVQVAQLQQFVGQVRSMRDEFLKTTPDFPAAYEHVRQIRANDLRDAGIPEHQLPAVLLQDEMTLAQAALVAGKNPAAAIYDMAKRHGYAAKPAAGLPATPPANPVLAAAQARLAQAAAGQAAAVAPPRGAAEVTYTLESLKDATDADINKVVQSDDLWHKVAGGRPAGKDIF